MKNEIKSKMTTAKKFVTTHKTAIACATGATAGAIAVVLVKKQLDKDKTLLIVTDEGAAHMHTGHSVNYDTPYGVVTTIIRPDFRVPYEFKD